MSHIAQQKYFKQIKKNFPQFFIDVKVLDIGSLDINGSNRSLFENSSYMGVDLGEGKNVDIISKGHELLIEDNYFDVVCSSEVFEHDMFYTLTILNMYRMLKPGGLMLFCCATTGRAVHGTLTNTKKDSPFTTQQKDWQDYYHNVTEKDFRKVLDIEESFSYLNISTEDTHHDLRFWGIKRQT